VVQNGERGIVADLNAPPDRRPDVFQSNLQLINFRCFAPVMMFGLSFIQLKTTEHIRTIPPHDRFAPVHVHRLTWFDVP